MALADSCPPQSKFSSPRLRAVSAAAQLIDPTTMTLQVIDRLKAVGASPSSTFVIPIEFTRLLGQVGDYLDQSVRAGSGTARS